MEVDFLRLPDRTLAYQRFIGASDKAGIIFLGGYASDMTGTKARFLAEMCRASNRSYVLFDYRGNGQSSGTFKDETIGSWYDDTLCVFDHLTEGPQIVVGSSMGGWLGLKLGIDRPARIKAFIGIAAAPDFTEDLMWLRMTELQRSTLERDGLLYDDNAPVGHHVPITFNLINEARSHLLLQKQIKVQCPVRLLHGLADDEVPWQHAIRILECVATADVRLTLIKDGDHRLSRTADLQQLWSSVTLF